MAPTITFSEATDRRSASITVTWYDLDEAWETAEVIKRAGIGRRGNLCDSGFYHDGVDIQNLVVEVRLRAERRLNSTGRWKGNYQLEES